MDYKAFTYRAAVDFVEIEVAFERPTQARYVSSILRSGLSVKGIDPATDEAFEHSQRNTSTPIFRVRLQDPRSYQQMMEWIAAFQARAEQWNGPAVIVMDCITAVEVAFDLYAKPGKADYADLAHAVMLLYRGARTIQGQKNHRLYRDGKGSGRSLPHDPERLADMIADGYNIAIGNRTDDHYQHAYIKDTDTTIDPETGKGKRYKLPAARHRARFENHWRGRALADLIGKHVTDLDGFNFATLAGHYNFRMEDPQAQGMGRAVLDASIQIGERKPEGAVRRLRISELQRKIPSVNRLHTKADTTLNARARDALRHLTEAWARPPETPSST